jgi:ABC-type sugar transport system substrate-binding protein
MLKTRTRIMAAGACATALMVLCACGSSDGSSSSQEQSGDSSTAVEEASARVDDLRNPVPLEVEPLSGKVPTGKVVADVNCSAPICRPGLLAEPVEELGWTTENFVFDMTKGAQDYVRAVDAAVKSKPDYLAINIIFGTEVIDTQLKQAKSDNIPIIGVGGVDATNVDMMVQSPEPLGAAGGIMADVALDDKKGPVQVAVPTDTSLPSLQATFEGVQKRIADVPGAKADDIKLNFSQPQATNVSAIINYLKSNPNTEYLLFPGTGFYAGIDQALASAGLSDKVKLVTMYPYEADLQAIKNNEFIAAVGAESNYQWRMADAMARLAVGDKLASKTPTIDFRLLTADNADFAGLDPADYKQAYRAAWRL